jgi:hypothetical protein
MMSREHRSAQHTARRENPTTETPLPLLISFAFDATGGRELVILQATEQQLSQTTSRAGDTSLGYTAATITWPLRPACSLGSYTYHSLS